MEREKWDSVQERERGDRQIDRLGEGEGRRNAGGKERVGRKRKSGRNIFRYDDVVLEQCESSKPKERKRLKVIVCR